MMERYRRGLEPNELLRAVARLLRTQRRADGLICSYLADLSDALKRHPALVLVYGDVHQLARYKLGLSLRSSRDRVRVGKALRQLARLRSALMVGDLSYSRVREVTRVARPDNERQWLRAARELSMRQLEKRVAACSGRTVRVPSETPGAPSTGSSSSATGSLKPGAPSTGSSSSATGSLKPGAPSTLCPSESTDGRGLQLPQHVWVLLDQAMREARAQSSQPLTDVEAMECVVRAALVEQSRYRLSLSRQPSQHATLIPTAADEAARNRIFEGSLENATQTELPKQRGNEGPDTTQSGLAKQCGSKGPEAAQSELPSTDTYKEGDHAWVAGGWADAGTPTSVSAGFAGKEHGVGLAPRDDIAEPSQSQRATEADSIGESFGARRAPLSSDAKQLLELIKGGRLWNVATLGYETGMPLPRLAVALTDLEFSRCVRRDVVGFYEFVRDTDDESPFREAS